jgi:glycosyltransferase involved in cell wall biosynthesis
MSSELSVVICSLNGADGLGRCLRALDAQTIRPVLEIVVVDDGSTDNTSEVASADGAILIRHAVNHGLSAARNSGVAAASSPIIAFLDDDCEPDPEWAERVIAGYELNILGVGGPVIPRAPMGFMSGYLRRHNPLRPLEIDLARSEGLAYRFFLYVRRQWSWSERGGLRDVYAFAGANMSFRRDVLLQIGRFDERFRFGAEEGDLCRRLGHTFPSGRLVFVPEAKVVHHFEPSLRDTLRRSRAYGRGSARLFRKWPTVSPTFFPGPVAVLATMILAIHLPLLIAAALLMPHLLYPQGMRLALGKRRVQCLLDAYVQLAQEGCEDLGFLEGLWRFRKFTPEPFDGSVQGVERQREARKII